MAAPLQVIIRQSRPLLLLDAGRSRGYGFLQIITPTLRSLDFLAVMSFSLFAGLELAEQWMLVLFARGMDVQLGSTPLHLSRVHSENKVGCLGVWIYGINKWLSSSFTIYLEGRTSL